MELPIDEFWHHSPAQIYFVFESRGAIQKKGSVSDFMQLAGGSGVAVEGEPGEVDRVFAEGVEG